MFVGLALSLMLAGALVGGCATGDEPLQGQVDSGRVDPPDVFFPKDTDSGTDEDVFDPGDSGDFSDVLDISDVSDVSDSEEDSDIGGEDVTPPGEDGGGTGEEDTGPGSDVGPVPCGGTCSSQQVCENNVCVDACQRTGSQCGVVIWSETEIQCGTCGSGSTCFENRCADNVGYRGITAGFKHTCATRADGTVRCWGSNAQGQLGNNQLGVDSSQPVGVHVLPSNVRGVNTGVDHTCGVLAGGQVYCWGKNTLGQLGNGMTTDQAVPVQATGLGGVESVAVGGAHSCVLLQGSGEIQCWGAGGQGQLGMGSPVSGNGISHTKAFVMQSQQARLANNTSLTLGTTHSCALHADGGVYCWGYNHRGQAGGQNNMHVWPNRIADLAPAISVAAGANHTCAVTQAGDVYCWGEGSKGQLGNGARLQSPSPVKVQFQGTTKAVRVVAGGQHTCAIDTQRRVWCWGDNSKGQLGGEIFDADRVQPYPVSNLTDVLTVSAGNEHTCAVRTNGTAWCWGENGVGQLGDGTKVERNKPAQVLN